MYSFLAFIVGIIIVSVILNKDDSDDNGFMG